MKNQFIFSWNFGYVCKTLTVSKILTTLLVFFGYTLNFIIWTINAGPFLPIDKTRHVLRAIKFSGRLFWNQFFSPKMCYNCRVKILGAANFAQHLFLLPLITVTLLTLLQKSTELPLLFCCWGQLLTLLQK